MRAIRLMVTVALIGLAACETPEPVTAIPGGAVRAGKSSDLDGMPDLIVDAKRLATSWVVYDQDLRKDFCSLVEGGVSPGVHRVLRFGVTTPNIGTADLVIGNPLDHVAAGDGLFEFATCHGHFHYRHYASYELVSATDGRVYLAAKKGFCMIDVTPWRSDAPPAGRVYDACGTLVAPGNQGISTGWADTYDKHIGGQYFVLDDSAAPVPPGEYLIRITVNPPFECSLADSLRPRDANGLCHNFVESNYDNNQVIVPITIPDRPGKTGFGPGAEQPPDSEPEDPS
ncbi:MAG TPA: lysyl oxidase family protein [Gemmatimonadales bacterium]|nr:lysyl oxidase family protein [Gemmatimonadales bacterium]